MILKRSSIFNCIGCCSVICSVILFSFSQSLADDWNTTDEILFASYTISSVIDYFQTNYIFEHPEKHHEWNPIIKNNKKCFIPLYFAGRIIGTRLLSNWLPKHRRAILLLSLSASSMMVGHNITVGIKCSF